MRTLRSLRRDETALLEQATLGNMNWCGERFTLDDVRSRPEFVHYTRLEPERGDFGVAACHDGEPVGVAWAMFLPATDPGYGFIDPKTPELSLWVDPSARGAGLGRALLRAAIARTRERGIAQVSLSVEADNVARHLYLSEGFVAVPGREDDGVMLRHI